MDGTVPNMSYGINHLLNPKIRKLQKENPLFNSPNHSKNNQLPLDEEKIIFRDGWRKMTS
jgi:hypothetical protein